MSVTIRFNRPRKEVTEPLSDAQPPKPPATGRGRWRRYLWQEDQLFFALSILIGIVSGLLVVCFRIAIEWGRLVLLGSALVPSTTRMIVVPTLAGLVVGILVLHVFPRARGSGVNQTKAALYIYNGYIELRTVIGKFITSALSIASGQSLGPEDPALQIGAGVASAMGRGLQLSRDKLRLLAPVGAAAGLAAAFNAPISAVLFVIEEVIGNWTAGVLGAVVLAAVSSTVVERGFLGYDPLFRIPAMRAMHPGELLAYAVLGVVGGITSLIFLKLIVHIRPRMKAMPRWTQNFQPAIAGLAIGLVGVMGFPQVMGAGYEFIDQAMQGQYTWRLLAILAGLKILSTTVSFVSGSPGGMFAPTLFIGAMLGGAVGGVERILFPHLQLSAAAYALVGMGVLFAGFLRAPMTSVFMVLEVSGDYSILLPVIVANTIAYLISRSGQTTPLFDVLSRQDGMHLPSVEEQRERAPLRVEDAMRPVSAPVLTSETIVEEAMKFAEAGNKPVLLVRHLPEGWSLVTPEQLRLLVAKGQSAMPLSLVLPETRLPAFYPDQPLDHALRHIEDQPLFPVVHRADQRQLEGVLSFDDVLRAYKRAGNITAEFP